LTRSKAYIFRSSIRLDNLQYIRGLSIDNYMLKILLNTEDNCWYVNANQRKENKPRMSPAMVKNVILLGDNDKIRHSKIGRNTFW